MNFKILWKAIISVLAYIGILITVGFVCYLVVLGLSTIIGKEEAGGVVVGLLIFATVVSMRYQYLLVVVEESPESSFKEGDNE
jgi:hypothetical protein